MVRWRYELLVSRYCSVFIGYSIYVIHSYTICLQDIVRFGLQHIMSFSGTLAIVQVDKTAERSTVEGIYMGAALTQILSRIGAVITTNP